MIQKSENRVQRLIEDFVFLDCRLHNHPKVCVNVLWDQPLHASDYRKPLGEKSRLRPLASTRRSRFKGVFEASDQRRSIISQTLDKHAYIVTTNIQELNDIRSCLAVPIAGHGVITFDSPIPNLFNENHLGLAQLLAALIAYTKLQLEFHTNKATTISSSLGKALRQIREEIGFTQSELAEKIGKSRIALSRWENGAQPPSWGPLYEWCSGLGLFSVTKGSLVTVVDITPKLLKILKEDPNRLRELTPSQFEQFVAERLNRMGFDVNLTGGTSLKDGGIDLIAVPKLRTVGSFLLAGQVKHHRVDQKTGRNAVDRLLAWQNSHFRLGLLVTNTAFTKDAKWVAMQDTNRPFLRLRAFEDLKRWLEGNFWSEEDWKEIPNKIELAPGVTISIPKPSLSNSLNIWPLSKLDL